MSTLGETDKPGTGYVVYTLDVPMCVAEVVVRISHAEQIVVQTQINNKMFLCAV